MTCGVDLEANHTQVNYHWWDDTGPSDPHIVTAYTDRDAVSIAHKRFAAEAFLAEVSQKKTVVASNAEIRESVGRDSKFGPALCGCL